MRILGQTIALVKLKDVVITSVDREDLRDGGAGHFVKCIQHPDSDAQHLYRNPETPCPPDLLHRPQSVMAAPHSRQKPGAGKPSRHLLMTKAAINGLPAPAARATSGSNAFAI